jgi:hypothetical protein
MVAKIVEFVEVSSSLAHRRAGEGGHLLIEDAVPQSLRSLDLAGRLSESDLKRPRCGENGPLLKGPLEEAGLMHIHQDRRFLFEATRGPVCAGHGPQALREQGDILRETMLSRKRNKAGPAWPVLWPNLFRTGFGHRDAGGSHDKTVNAAGPRRHVPEKYSSFADPGVAPN